MIRYVGIGLATASLLASFGVQAGIYGGGLTDLAVGIAAGETIGKDSQVKLDIRAPGCVVKGPDGKPLTLMATKDGQLLIPKGTTFAGQCIVSVKK